MVYHRACFLAFVDSSEAAYGFLDLSDMFALWLEFVIPVDWKYSTRVNTRQGFLQVSRNKCWKSGSLSVMSTSSTSAVNSYVEQSVNDSTIKCDVQVLVSQQQVNSSSKSSSGVSHTSSKEQKELLNFKGFCQL